MGLLDKLKSLLFGKESVSEGKQDAKPGAKPADKIVEKPVEQPKAEVKAEAHLHSRQQAMSNRSNKSILFKNLRRRSQWLTRLL